MLLRAITWSDAPTYLVAQVLGAFIGVASAHLMFGEALLQFSHHVRAGDWPVDAPGFVVAQLLGAFAATVLFRWLVPSLPSEAKEVAFPHAHTGRQ